MKWLLLFCLLATPLMAHPADTYVSHQPLGALPTRRQVTFRVFAPTASRVDLHLYDRPSGGSAQVVRLRRAADGTWDTTVPAGRDYYTYRVYGDDAGFVKHELIDPYARAVTSVNGRGIVVRDRTPVAPRPKFPQQDAIIYEMHVRDFTLDPDSRIEQRGTYLGLTEGGTRLFQHDAVTTGLDHLVELGINTVQIMPISEFLNEGYGWGYDSVHFNAPELWYTRSDPVMETRRMVDALHRKGIRVVLDMVYNHTMEVPRKRVYSFEGVVPGYYYRKKPDGSLWNGSGVGNEFRTEAPMARRFIVDSVAMWVTEYGVDGFRFDLMGLFDMETMRAIVERLRAIDPELLIYGEPWAAGPTPIEVLGKGKQRGLGFGVFNDHFRDALKGHVFTANDGGFVQFGRKVEVVKQGIVGSIDDFANHPIESINYVECHDNHTFWDRLVNSTSETADREAMNRLGAAILFTSQGIPFIQSGQEFRRTKWGDENSYKGPDAVNYIRWSDKVRYKSLYEYYRGLIKLRHEHPMFRLRTAAEVRKAVSFSKAPEGVIAYRLDDVTGRDPWKQAYLIFNGSPTAVQMPLDGAWRLTVDGSRTGLNEGVSGSVQVAPHSAAILYR